MQAIAIRSRSWKRFAATQAFRKRRSIRYRRCRKRCLFRRNSFEKSQDKEAHEVRQAQRQQEKWEREKRRCAAEGARLFAEGWRGARSFHGCGRELSGGEARDLCSGTGSYRLATAGTRASGAVGHPGIRPQPEPCVPGISGRLLAEDPGSASGGWMER